MHHRNLLWFTVDAFSAEDWNRGPCIYSIACMISCRDNNERYDSVQQVRTCSREKSVAILTTDLPSASENFHSMLDNVQLISNGITRGGF